MLDTLKWIFDSGWRFAGVVLLLIIVLSGFTDIARALPGAR